MQLPSLNTVTTMSSLEIAELTGKEHKNVIRDIRVMLDDLKKHGADLSHVIEEKDSRGYTALFKLNRELTDTLLTGYSIPSRYKVIQRWHELESHQVPKTLPEALRLAADLAEKNLALENKIAIDAPKVEFAMAVRNMEGACHLGVFCKTLTPTIGRNTFFKWLRECKVLDERNIPYQQYKDAGYFVVIEQTPYTDSQGKSHPAFTTLVTGKGQVWLEKQYRKSV